MIEPVQPFKLHPTSIQYIYKVFEHRWQWWMGICMHTHTITTTNLAPDLGELVWILGDVRVQTMPLRYGWGCRTFQTASYIQPIHIIYDVWAPSGVVDGHADAHSHRYHHKPCPRFGRAGLNPGWCKCAHNATKTWLSLYNLSNCIPHPSNTYIRCLSIGGSGGWAYVCTLTPLPPQT